MSVPRSADLPVRLATLAILALGLVVTLVLNLPGHLSYDSVVQLLDGRTGRYHTWHPPFMAWLLGLGDHLIPGAALYVCAQATLLFGAFAAIVLTARRVRPWAPAAALALVALPHLVLWQGIVWKDVLFADLLVAGFVAMALAFAPGRTRTGRGVAIALALVLLTAAALVRQNGAFAPAAGAAAIGWIAWRSAHARPARAAILGGGFLLLALTGGMLANAALNQRSVDGSGSQAQVRSLEIYDLAGAVAREPRMPLDRLPPAVGAGLREAAGSDYTPERIDPLQRLPAFGEWTRLAAPAIDAQWRDLLLHHPLSWARQRLAVFGWMIAAPDLARCHPEFTGVDGDPAMMARLGLKPGWRRRDLAMTRYAAAFHPTPVYAHWAYALTAVALLALLLRSGQAQDAVFAAMLVAALAFAASFFVIGVACDYRYLYALDLAVLAAGFRWIIDPGGRSGPQAPRR